MITFEDGTTAYKENLTATICGPLEGTYTVKGFENKTQMDTFLNIADFNENNNTYRALTGVKLKWINNN